MDIIKKLKEIKTSEELIKSVGNAMTLHKKIYANIELIHKKWTEILKERPPKMKNIIGYFYSKRPILLSKYNINNKADQTDIIRELYEYKKNKNQSLNNVKEQPITVFDDTIENLLNEFNNKVDENKKYIDDKKKYINDKYQRINEIPLPKPPNTNLLDNMFKFIKQEKGDIQKSRSHIMELLDKAIKDIENETKDITIQSSKNDILKKSEKINLYVNGVKQNVKLFDLALQNENDRRKYVELINNQIEYANNLKQDLINANKERNWDKSFFETYQRKAIASNNDILSMIKREYEAEIQQNKNTIDKAITESTNLKIKLEKGEESLENSKMELEKREARIRQLQNNLDDANTSYTDKLSQQTVQAKNEIDELKAKHQIILEQKQQEIKKSKITDEKKEKQIKQLKEQQTKNTQIFKDWIILQNKTRNELEELKQQLNKEKYEHKTEVKKLERELGIQKEEAKKESSFGPLEVVTNIFPVPFKNSLGFHIGNITTTHTGKKPYTSTDTVDHYLYNLYNQIQDERSSQKAMNDDKTHFKNHTRKMVHYPVRFRTDDQGNRIQPNNQQVKLNIPNQGNRIQPNINKDDDDTPEELGGGKNNTRRTRKRVVKIKHKRNTRRPIKKINNKTRKENK